MNKRLKNNLIIVVAFILILPLLIGGYLRPLLWPLCEPAPAEPLMLESPSSLKALLEYWNWIERGP